MKKKWITMITVVAVLLTTAAGFVAANESLTLRQSVERAVTSNVRIKLALLGVAKTGIENDSISKLAALYRQMLNKEEPEDIGPDGHAVLIIQTIKGESDVDLALKQEEVTRNQLAFEAQESYLRLIKAMEQKKLLEQNLERARDLKRLADVAYQVGTAARSEVMRSEAHVVNMEAALLGADSGVIIAKAALNITLGRAISESLFVEESPTLPEIGGIHLASGTTRATSDSIDVLKARIGLRMAIANLEYVRKYPRYPDEVKVAEIAVEEAALFLQLTEDRIRFEVFALYHKLTGMEKQLAARNKGLELAAENYRLSKLRYELGVATQGEVIDTMLALSDQEIKLSSEKYDYYIDYLSWRLKTALPVN